MDEHLVGGYIKRGRHEPNLLKANPFIRVKKALFPITSALYQILLLLPYKFSEAQTPLSGLVWFLSRCERSPHSFR